MSNGYALGAVMRGCGILALLLTARPESAAAQPTPSPAQNDLGKMPIATLLQRVGKETAGEDPYASRKAIRGIVGNRSRLPRARIDSVLVGLERLASADNEQVRWAAVEMLADFGRSHSSFQALPGTYARLARIYASSRDPLVRATIVGELPELDERALALPFLTSLASAPADRQPFSGATDEAIHALARMGDPGMVVLRRLYEQGELRGVQDVGTNVFLSNTARSRGWGPRGRSTPR